MREGPPDWGSEPDQVSGPLPDSHDAEDQIGPDMAAPQSLASPHYLDSTPRRHHAIGNWAAHIRIQWPEGIERHPRLLDRVQRDLDRPCVLDLDYDGLWLTCALTSEDGQSADRDAQMLATELLTRLGLGEGALRDCVTVPVERPADEPEPARLRLVR